MHLQGFLDHGSCEELSFQWWIMIFVILFVSSSFYVIAEFTARDLFSVVGTILPWEVSKQTWRLRLRNDWLLDLRKTASAKRQVMIMYVSSARNSDLDNGSYETIRLDSKIVTTYARHRREHIHRLMIARLRSIRIHAEHINDTSAHPWAHDTRDAKCKSSSNTNIRTTLEYASLNYRLPSIVNILFVID